MNELLDLALKAHGGLERWREVKSLDVRISLTAETSSHTGGDTSPRMP